MDNLLTGTNFDTSVQGSVSPNYYVNPEDPTYSNEEPYNANFWDWLQSVSGLNLYKNLFGGWKNNPGNSFFDFLYRDPNSGYSQFDSYKTWTQSRVSKAVSDMLGIDPSASTDNGSLFDDIPQSLIDIYKAGLEMFRNNSISNQTFNSDQAEEERAWARLMRQTAYQDTMEDLKKAGINPLLAFGSFGPTATPSGASASSSLGNSNSLFSSMASSVLGDSRLTMGLLTALLGIFRIFQGSTKVNSNNNSVISFK